MTQIHDPGAVALRLLAQGRKEELPQQLVQQALLALENWSSPEKPALAQILDRWIVFESEYEVSAAEVASCARMLAAAAHEISSEEGQLGRLLPAVRGRIVGGSIEQVGISALAVLSLALHRFSMIGGLGARITHPSAGAA
jgi:hypothetical protein